MRRVAERPPGHQASGRLSLKGFDEPVQAFEVIWQAPPSVGAVLAGESEGTLTHE